MCVNILVPCVVLHLPSVIRRERRSVYMFASVNPLAGRVDFGVSLNGGHDGCGFHLDVAGSLDDSLESGRQVVLARRGKSERLGVAVNAERAALRDRCLDRAERRCIFGCINRCQVAQSHPNRKTHADAMRLNPSNRAGRS